MFYLNVRAEDRRRSVALNEAIFRQLQTHFQQLRDAKAESMVEELTKTVALARSRSGSGDRRAGIDRKSRRQRPGRAAFDAGHGRQRQRPATQRRGNPRQLRENVLADKTDRQLLDVLAEAQNDSGRLVAMPNRLLESHPSLRRLKDGLIDAQLRTVSAAGNDVGRSSEGLGRQGGRGGDRADSAPRTGHRPPRHRGRTCACWPTAARCWKINWRRPTLG